jgi:hypothetical protein
MVASVSVGLVVCDTRYENLLDAGRVGAYRSNFVIIIINS